MAKQDITNREKGGKIEKLPQEGYIKTKDTTTNKNLIFAMYALLYTIGTFTYLLLGGEITQRLGYWVICITFSPLVVVKLFSRKFNNWLNQPYSRNRKGGQS